MKTVGIDVGLDGAIALIDGPIALAWDLPTLEVRKGRRELDPIAFRNQLIEIGPVDMVVVERLTAMPRNGSQTAFSQGDSFGVVRGVLSALARRVTYIRPSDWTRDLGKPKEAGKDWSRARAIDLYPTAADLLARVKDHDRAEAILIAHWWLTRSERTEHAA